MFTFQLRIIDHLSKYTVLCTSNLHLALATSDKYITSIPHSVTRYLAILQRLCIYYRGVFAIGKKFMSSLDACMGSGYVAVRRTAIMAWDELVALRCIYPGSRRRCYVTCIHAVHVRAYISGNDVN